MRLMTIIQHLLDVTVIDQMADGTLVSLLCHPCVTLASP